jgi:hypothetical protein
LSPAEGHIRPQRIEPRDETDVAALVAGSQPRPEGQACFVRIAPVFDGLIDVRLKLFVNFASEALAAKNVGNA